MTAISSEKIYGLEFIELCEPVSGLIRWRIFIDHPFALPDGRLQIGINQRAIEIARKRGVQAFILGDGPNEKYIRVPNKTMLKEMERAWAYQDQPSIFSGREGYKIYYFKI